MVRSSLVSRITLALLLGAGLAGGLSGCKSDEGQRCQINDDCASGLVCAPSTDTCVEPANDDGGVTGIDAPIDAFEGDAADPDAALPIDAAPAIDAPIDASPDA